MSELIFTTRGQAEMLAAQEAVRKKAVDTKAEFEEAARATGAWDAATMKLKSSAESALRSVSTEQEKILDKITKIQQAQEKGLIPPEQAKKAEEALTRLRQQWIDLDEATLKAKEDQARAAEETARVEKEAAEATAEAKRSAAAETRKQEAAYESLKSTAEAALRSIQTEEEAIEDKIRDIETAIEQGLFADDEIDDAEDGLERLKDQLTEVRKKTEEAGQSGDKVAAVFAKAFDPMQIAKMVAGFVGVKAIIGQVREEFEDLQTAVDKRIAASLGPKAEGDRLADAASAADKAFAEAQARKQQRAQELEKAKAEESAAEPGSPARVRAHATTAEAVEAWKRSIDEQNAAQDVAVAAAAERDRYMATPGYKKAVAISERQKVPEELYGKLAEMGDLTQVSTEELAKLADAFREAGQGALARKLTEFIARIDDGTVSIDEVQKALAEVAENIRGTTGDQQVIAGPDVIDVPGRPRTDAELSKGEQRQIQLLEEAIRAYDRMEAALRDGGLVGDNT